MPDPSDLFKPSTKDNIKVGYISTTRGYVTGVGINDANIYAKKDPGTKFILQNRDYIKYLNINEVNALDTDVLVSAGKSCEGVVWEAPVVPPKVIFAGGGGVGVVGNPVISKPKLITGTDGITTSTPGGALLAVDVISGGFGYKYAPVTTLSDTSGKGAGAHLVSIVGVTSTQTIKYDKEEDFEEYIIDEDNVIGIGSWYGPDGKVIGRWDPSLYTGSDKVNFDIVTNDYIKKLKDIALSGVGGAPPDVGKGGGAGVFWWAAIPPGPNLVNFGGRERDGYSGTTANRLYKVQHVAWNETPPPKNNKGQITDWSTNGWMNTHAISPVPMSHAKGSDHAQEMFTLEWDVDFPWDGEYTFKGCADNQAWIYLEGELLAHYKLGQGGAEGKVLSLPSLLKKEVTKGSHKLRIDLKNNPIVEEQKFQASSKTYGSLLQLEDIPQVASEDQGGVTYDDLQCYAKMGRFFDINANEAKYRVDASFNQPEGSEVQVEYKVTSNSAFINKIEVKDLFTEQGPELIQEPDITSTESREASAIFVTEGSGQSTEYYMEVTGNELLDIDFDFRVHEDDKLIGGGPSVETVNIETEKSPLEFSILPQDVNMSGWPNRGSTVVKKGTFKNGKRYKVSFTGTRWKSSNTSRSIQYIGLRETENLRFVNDKTLQFDDNAANGWDTNGTFTIDRGDVTFSDDGLRLIGPPGKVTLTYNWNDNPDIAGVALQQIKLGSTTWTQFLPSAIQYIGLRTTANMRFVNNRTLEFDDNSENGFDVNARFTIDTGSAVFSSDGTKLLGPGGSVTMTYTWNDDPDIAGVVLNEIKIEDQTWTQSGTTGSVTRTFNYKGIEGSQTQTFYFTPESARAPQLTGGPEGEESRIAFYDNRTDGGATAGPDLIGDVRAHFTILNITQQADTIPSIPGQLKLKQLNTTFKKTVVVGQVYPVTVTNAGQGLMGNTPAPIGALKAVDVVNQDAQLQTNTEATIEKRNIFNTVDFQTSANRKLWRTNVNKKGGFMNEYGVCPFNTSETLPDNPYAGTHTIRWNHINFPISGNYTIRIGVDDNVDLTIGTSDAGGESVTITKEGYRFPPGGGIKSTGVGTYVRYIEAGMYTIKADLNQIAGGQFGFGKIKSEGAIHDYSGYGLNPMALAITIDTTVAAITGEVPKSWHYNPLGVALNIRAPLPPAPVAPKPTQEGRCPSNPTWSTRFPNAKDGTWYPVRFDSWGKFHNKYGMSPVPPLPTGGTDKGGIVFTNRWDVQIEHDGYYKLKAIIDDIGKIYVDGELRLDLSDRTVVQKGENTFKLTKGIKEVKVEIENNSTQVKKLIDQKIFNTKDWIDVSPPTSGGIQKDVNFAVTTNSALQNSINIKGLFFEQGGTWGESTKTEMIPVDTIPARVEFIKKGSKYYLKAYGNKTVKATFDFRVHEDDRNIGGGPSIEFVNVQTMNNPVRFNTLSDTTMSGWPFKGSTDVKDAIFENGKEYEVTFGGLLSAARSTPPIKYIGLKSAAHRRFANSKTLEFDDNPANGWDTNATFTIDSGPATFSDDGLRLIGTQNGSVTLTYSWNDNPDIAGVALDEIQLGGQTWKQSGPSTIQYIGLRTTENMRFVNNRTLEFDDNSENGWDTNATFTIDSGDATFSNDGLKLLGPGGTVTMTYTWNDNPDIAGVVLDEIKIGSTTWTQSGTTGSVTHTFDYTGITGSVTRTINFIANPNPTSPPLIGGMSTPTICFFDGDTSAGATIGPDFNGDVRAYITALNVIQMDEPDLVESGPLLDKKLVQLTGKPPIIKDVVIGQVYEVEIANAGTGLFPANYVAPPNELKASGGVLTVEDIPHIAAEDQGGVTHDDLVCTASHGRFYDIQGSKCKYIIDPVTAGTVVRDGITYEGPKLFNYKHRSYGSWLNSDGVSPDYSLGDTGKTHNYVWKNVDFPETGDYTFKFANDAHGSLYLDGEVVIDGDFDTIAGISARDRSNWDPGLTHKRVVNKGKHTIAVAPKGRLGLTDVNADGLFKKLSDDYMRGQQAWENNASAMAVLITRQVDAYEGTAQSSKSWYENPISISAELVPPPCPRTVGGGGVVKRVDVLDPGNGYPTPTGGGYSVVLPIETIDVVDPGINYDCAKDKLVIVPDNNVKVDIECDNFGRIKNVNINDPGEPFTDYPEIYMDSPTGVGAEFRPQFTVIRDPVEQDIDPDKLIQVTDLVGLKQTGYYDGRPYYGAVFYRDGVRYAGYYETAGRLVQIYDTLQESIDGMVTTPPSAIQRQGTDIASDDPNLNIPNTPDTLT